MGVGHPPPPAPRWLDVTYRWGTPPLIGVGVLNFLGVFGGFRLPLGFIVFGVAAILYLVRSPYVSRSLQDR